MDGVNAGAKDGVSISNVGDGYREVEYHVGTYHSLEILWRRPADHVIGTSGPPRCGELAVGEPLSVSFNSLNHCGGSVSRAAVVVVETTTAADKMKVFSGGGGR